MDIRFTWEAVFGHVKMLCKDSKSGDNLFMASSQTRCASSSPLPNRKGLE